MNYNNVSIRTIMKIIKRKRLELNAGIEKNGIGKNVPLSDEVLQKSRELDELINIVQIKKRKEKSCLSKILLIIKYCWKVIKC